MTWLFSEIWLCWLWLELQNLFLFAKSTTSEINYSLEMWGTPLIFLAWHEVGKFTSDLDLWGRKTYIFDPDFEVRRHSPLILILGQEDWLLNLTTSSTGSLCKERHGKRRVFFSLPACPCLLSKSVHSPALEPTSLGFQNLLRSSGDIQSQELSNFWILGLSVHIQPLLN